MQLTKSRLGALFLPDRVTWSGSVQAYDDSTFTLTVTSAIGNLSDLAAGLAVYKTHKYGPKVRIRSVNAGARTITLCENGIEFEAGDILLVYPARVPWTRFQYIDDDGNIYKDYDISFPGDAASQPPLAIVKHRRTPGSGDYSPTGGVWLATDTGIQFDATDSIAVYPSASISSYSWTPGTDGTITAGAGTGTITVEWSSEGFRYLKLTLTDSQGTSADRYIPIWIGSSAWPITSCRLTWGTERGWKASLSLQHTVLPLYPSPMCVVDLDTYETLFFGFLRTVGSGYEFPTASHDVQAGGILDYARAMHAYPFGVETNASPTAWNEVKTLTLARALAFLLNWHSNIPEIVNCDVGTPSSREIQEQPFTTGNIGAQMQEVANAAHKLLREQRGGGGSTLVDDPLYREASYFDGLTAVDLSSESNVYPSFDIERGIEEVSEVRVSGVYQNDGGGFDPVIAKAPAHPGALGHPRQVTNMAPISQAEAVRWAEREYALANVAGSYTVQSKLDVEPAEDLVADLVDGERIAVEDVTLSLGRDLAWDLQIGGRNYGDSPPGDLEPIPTVTDPDPDPPDDSPPVTPITDPEPTWPTTLYVATVDDGVFYTENFSAPTGDQPTWATVNGGLPTTTIRWAAIDPETPADYQYVLVENAGTATDYDLYRRLGSGNWSALLTSAQARTLTGEASGELYRIAIDKSDGQRMYCLFGDPSVSDPYCLASSDRGANWNAYKLIEGKTLLEFGNLEAHGAILYVGASVNPIISRGYVFYSENYGVSWTRVLSRPLGASSWSPSVYMHPEYSGVLLVGAMETGTVTYNKNDAYVYEYLGRSQWSVLSELPQGSAFSLDDSFPVLSFFDGDTDYQALVDEGTLRYTEDAWTNASALTIGSGNSMSDVPVRQLYTPNPLRPGWRIFGLPLNGDSLILAKSHVIYASADNGVSLTGRAGSSPITGVDSIPYDCGGVAPNGVLVVG
jgi:hypothetical protein